MQQEETHQIGNMQNLLADGKTHKCTKKDVERFNHDLYVRFLIGFLILIEVGEIGNKYISQVHILTTSETVIIKS